MGKVIYLPFEELPQRYTKMWNDAFIRQMRPEDIIIKVPGWNKPKKITTGQFLDTYDTIAYKAKQLQAVAELFKKGLIEDHDTFFVPDIFFPGLEAIRYMAELSDIIIHIVAFNHAGRADETDFVQNLETWADYSEEAWHRVTDVVLVGSQFHKERVMRKFGHMNVRATGAIWSAEWMAKHYSVYREKEDYCIWPHRICAEKGFDEFRKIAEVTPRMRFIITSCGKEVPNLRTTLPRNVEYWPNLTKRQYYEVFAKAKYYLSTAYQETFGYTVQEAIFFGCQILAPRHASYPEYLPDVCLYNRGELMRENALKTRYEVQQKTLAFNVNTIPMLPDNAKKIYDICQDLC